MPEMSPDQVPDELVELFDETAKNALLTQTRLEDVDRIALAAVVARVRAEEYCKADAETEMVFNDLRAILRALGLSDAARPYSAHEVVQRDILPAIERVRADERRKIAEEIGDSAVWADPLGNWSAEEAQAARKTKKLILSRIARGGDQRG